MMWVFFFFFSTEADDYSFGRKEMVSKQALERIRSLELSRFTKNESLCLGIPRPCGEEPTAQSSVQL